MYTHYLEIWRINPERERATNFEIVSKEWEEKVAWGLLFFLLLLIDFKDN